MVGLWMAGGKRGSEIFCCKFCEVSKHVGMAFGRVFHRFAVYVEDGIDVLRRKVWRVFRRNEPAQIAAYTGYAHEGLVLVHGRVLADRVWGGPLECDGWWQNLKNTWRRWESSEVPFVGVRLRYGDEVVEVETDDEGYYNVEMPARGGDDERVEWHEVEAECRGVRGVHRILVPPRRAEFGVISDLDDTVIHTGITSIWLAAKLTFLENARSREPLEGVGELYEEMVRGEGGFPQNPIFYISSSPWNLYDLLRDFLKLNEIPEGPMLLRDVGLDRTKFIKEKGHGHKFRKALRVMDDFPEMDFLLIGDSGQEDPEIYADVVRERPGRVKAIYIRDIDRGVGSERAELVMKSKAASEELGVPMIFSHDSEVIRQHFRGLKVFRL